MDYYSFADPEGMKGLVGVVGLPIADTLPMKWSNATINPAKIRKSPPAKDRRPNYRATPPTAVVLICGYDWCVS